jgi:hypothetical protein
VQEATIKPDAIPVVVDQMNLNRPRPLSGVETLIVVFDESTRLAFELAFINNASTKERPCHNPITGNLLFCSTTWS